MSEPVTEGTSACTRLAVQTQHSSPLHLCVSGDIWWWITAETHSCVLYEPLSHWPRHSLQPQVINLWHLHSRQFSVIDMDKNHTLKFLRIFNGFIHEFKLPSTGFVPILATAIYVWRVSSDTAPYWQAIADIIKKVLTRGRSQELQ